jgi:hypothetical protein
MLNHFIVGGFKHFIRVKGQVLSLGWSEHDSNHGPCTSTLVYELFHAFHHPKCPGSKNVKSGQIRKG